MIWLKNIYHNNIFKIMSSFNIIFNSSNLINTDDKNVYRYNFINGSFKIEKDYYLSINYSQIPYSFFNISQKLNNNSFNIIWPKAGNWITYNIVIPDGFYSYANISDFIKYKCVELGLYLVDSNGEQQNFIQVRSNTTYYKVEFNLSLIPSSLGSYTNPANLTLPTVSQTPRIEILNNDFKYYVGMNTQIFPAVSSYSFYQKLSDFTPNITPNNSIVVSCNLVNNEVSIPSNIIGAIPIQNTSFGSNIYYENKNNINKVKIKEGIYNYIEISLLNDSLKNLTLQDPNLLISLLITK